MYHSSSFPSSILSSLPSSYLLSFLQILSFLTYHSSSFPSSSLLPLILPSISYPQFFFINIICNNLGHTWNQGYLPQKLDYVDVTLLLPSLFPLQFPSFFPLTISFNFTFYSSPSFFPLQFTSSLFSPLQFPSNFSSLPSSFPSSPLPPIHRYGKKGTVCMQCKNKYISNTVFSCHTYIHTHIHTCIHTYIHKRSYVSSLLIVTSKSFSWLTLESSEPFIVYFVY